MSTQPITPQPSCQDLGGSGDRTLEEALHAMDRAITPVAGRERLAVRSALGRVLADDVVSPFNVPSHTNSAMDGYALRGNDLPPEDGQRTLAVIGTSWAGRPYAGTVGPGECVRIMTGAKMPEGTDTVVIQERVERDGDRIRLDRRTKPGDNVRQAGEDLATGQTVLQAGRRLTPADLGLLASLGLGEVTVRRRPRVAFFSTGDELRSIGEPLGEGEIYDSNRYTLHGMLTRLGVELLDMGVVRDRREDVRTAFREAGENADAILTSGGASVGEADYVTEILEETGTVAFWKIAIKPGHPVAFGHVGSAVFFGLPGNPVSVMATFYQCVQPMLRRLMGETGRVTPRTFRVPCLSRLKKRPGRTEFQRGILDTDEQGRTVVRSTGLQGSGILRSMSAANCFIVLPHDCDGVAEGDAVDVQPFEGLG